MDEQSMPPAVEPDPALLVRPWHLPASIFEHIARIAAQGASWQLASTHLHGVYASCHAGRMAISPLIAAATITLDSRQAVYGQACGWPLQAACLRRLTLRMGEARDALALFRLLSEHGVRGMLARVRELEITTLDSVAPVPIDLAAVAAAFPTSLQTLTLRLRSAGALDVTPLAAIPSLCSLAIYDQYGSDLDFPTASRLTALTALTRLDIGPVDSQVAYAMMPGLVGLRRLADLSISYVTHGDNSGSHKLQRMSQFWLLGGLAHLTRLHLLADYDEGLPSDPPIRGYLEPITRCQQLVRLELPDHCFTSVQGFRLLQERLPRLAFLQLHSLAADQASLEPLLSTAPRPPSALAHLKLQTLGGSLAALASLLPLPPRVEVRGELCLSLGSACTPEAVAVVAERLARLASEVEVEFLDLAWARAAPPPCSTASVIAALARRPARGPEVKALRLSGWRADAELIEQVARVAPKLERIGFGRNTQAAAATSAWWAALSNLRQLRWIDAMCALDLEQLGAYAAGAPTLTTVRLYKDHAEQGMWDDMKRAVAAQRKERGHGRLTLCLSAFPI